jgi:hypothetical protein
MQSGYRRLQKRSFRSFEDAQTLIGAIHASTQI